MDYREANNRDRLIECRAFLSIADYVEDDAKLYFSNTNYNGLVIVDKKTWTVEQMIPFKGEERAAQNLHLRCVKKEDKICFLPAESKSVHIYDIKAEKQYICGFLNQNKETEAQGKWDYFIYDDQIYLLPGRGRQRMWRWNVSKNDLEMEEWWSVSKADSALRHGSMDDERFYSLATGTNQLFITNMYKRLTDMVCLPDGRINNITYDGKNFWYTMEDNLDIVCWNPKEGILNRYNLQDNFGVESDRTYYGKIYFTAGNLFIFTGIQQRIYVLNPNNKNVTAIYNIKCSRGAFQLEEIVPSVKCVGNTLICPLQNAGDMVFIDLDTLEIKQCGVMFSMNVKDQEYEYRIALRRNALLYEDSDRVGLDTVFRFCMENEEG